MVTFNVRDFPRVVGEWAAAGEHHAGCLMFVGIDHGEFGLILAVVEAAASGRPEQDDWRDHASWGTRET